MKHFWIVVVAAAIVVFATVTFLLSREEPQSISSVPTGNFTQAVQLKPVKPKGFTDAQVRRAGEVYAEVVTALNDLDAAMGIKRTKNAEGVEVITKVNPSFGMSRMSRTIKHGDNSVWTNGVHRAGDPWLLVFAASGKPLTAENLREATRFGKNPMVEEMAAQIRKQVAAANLGQDFDFQTKKHYGYAKPLKLTKKECLSCHGGMKVGDTVAIAVFTHLRDPKSGK